MDDAIATKVVNALIPEAEMGFAARFIVGMTDALATESVLDAAKKKKGGLWVGGTVIIQQRTLVFRPNWLNRLVHKAEYTVRIPLEEISKVNVRSAPVTKIIDVITREGEFSFRCYGAEAFADLIRRQLDEL
jgi:hypothetical protein